MISGACDSYLFDPNLQDSTYFFAVSASILAKNAQVRAASRIPNTADLRVFVLKFDKIRRFIVLYLQVSLRYIRKYTHISECAYLQRIRQTSDFASVPTYFVLRNDPCGESAFFYASLTNVVASAAHNRQIDAIAHCRCGQCATILAQKSQGNVDRIEYTSDFTVHTAENLDFIVRKRKHFAFCGKHFISFRRVCGSKLSASSEKYAKNPQAPLLFGGQNLRRIANFDAFVRHVHIEVGTRDQRLQSRGKLHQTRTALFVQFAQHVIEQ